jgi:hypothetical protein
VHSVAALRGKAVSNAVDFQLPIADVKRLAMLAKELADIVGRLIAGPSAAPQPASLVSTKPAPISPLAATPVTLLDVRRAYLALGKSKDGGAAILDVLGNFRLCYFDDARPDQYAPLARAFQDALEALGGPPPKRQRRKLAK